MHIILGGTGHIGEATAKALLDRGELVTIVTRDEDNGAPLAKLGAGVAVCEVRDTQALREVFRSGRRAFLLNPPADPATDTDVEERATVASIVAVLEGSGLQKVVSQSTYGTRPGEGCGDLTVLYELEQALAVQPIPASIQRAAYYMTNCDALLPIVRDEGVLPTLFPADLALPMVAPQDCERLAARSLTEPADGMGLHHVKGPRRYISADALGHKVEVRSTPREAWQQTFEDMGFFEPAARPYTRMTAATVDGANVFPDDPERGTVTLQAHIHRLTRDVGT